MRPLLLVLVVLIGACSGNAGSEVTTIPTQITTSTTTTTTTVPTTTTSEPPPTFPEIARALVTPTGVVVSVLEETTTGFRVTTPCGNEATVLEGTTLGTTQVVIDPGHGGQVDTGAVGANGLMEKHLNLEVSQALEADLIVRGIDVLLTRTADYASRLGVRAGLADRVNADLLISIHHNAPTPGPSPRPGTEVFIQSTSEASRRLGGLVWTRVMAALSDFDIEWTAAPDAGVLSVLSTQGSDAYGMISGPRTVSVLAEMAYISNPVEAELFATAEYVEAASDALADAVEGFLTTEATGAGYVAEPRIFNPQPGIGGSLCVDPALE
ncbi:MAG: lytC [Acidimicrobiia bacterium]|jgi:N-acetylmuramoyl-L-alanine amidase|nr:lytC [Acidimicrobiia bacterium]